MSSEFKSEMSSLIGDTGGVLYSCEVVLLLSDCGIVADVGDCLSLDSMMSCRCVVSCWWSGSF